MLDQRLEKILHLLYPLTHQAWKQQTDTTCLTYRTGTILQIVVYNIIIILYTSSHLRVINKWFLQHWYHHNIKQKGDEKKEYHRHVDIVYQFIRATIIRNTTKRRENEPFDPWEWLVSNFSLQYHHWIAHEGHENKAHDQQLKKLLIVRQILLDSALGNTLGTVWRRCILMLECKGLIKRSWEKKIE